jgi:hypothetical protein
MGRTGAEAGEYHVVAQRSFASTPNYLNDEGSGVRHRFAAKAGVNGPHHGVQRSQVVTIQQSGPGSVGHGVAVSVQFDHESIVVELHIAMDVLIGL